MPLPRNGASFIPLPTEELLALLCADRAAAGHQGALCRLASLLRQERHRCHHDRRQRLHNNYRPFDPDADTASVLPAREAERQGRLNGLLSDLNWLAGRAGFRHLSREEFDPMLAGSSDWGIHMKVDFGVFEHLAVFVRGEAHEVRTLRSWKTLYQPREVDLPVYRRLLLVLKLRPGRLVGPGATSEHVYVKLFKDIPRVDVDMLLPGARVKLFLLDRGKIGVGLLTGLATMAWKMSAELLGFLHSYVLPSSALWGLIVGSLSYGYKTYFDYQTARQAYHLNLTQSLYFQSLDGNAGVLARLAEEAEDQEARAALLAYFCLWRYAGEVGPGAEEIEAMMDLYLEQYAQLPVLCSARDALAELVRLGLAAPVGAGGYVVCPPEEAVGRLLAAGAGGAGSVEKLPSAGRSS